MLDDDTRNHCHRVNEMADRQGWDLFETLDRAGLLVTTDKRVMIETSTLSALLIALEAQQPTAFSTLGGAQTVTGAVTGVIKFIEMFTKSLQR